MIHLALRHHPDVLKGPCGLCKQSVTQAEGLQLVLVDSHCPVCPGCARKESPALSALLGLASAAERVGKINQHTVSPPLSALLELARAAETYTVMSPRPVAAESDRPARSA